MINYMIMSLKQKEIKFEPMIKLNHNIYTQPHRMYIYVFRQMKSPNVWSFELP